MDGVDVGGSAGPAIDTTARRAYEDRIRDLQEEVEEARAMADLGRAERAEAELDTLVTHLASAVGLASRTRETGAATERARSAVTQRLRATIRTLTDLHPTLGTHLQASIRTGIVCAYEPDPVATWLVASDAR
ncbi:MAG: hypothetical protein S0880_36820 [Actinomycetota bacterium]|nr:hypothetical protein [Actinomycetota bacterium]